MVIQFSKFVQKYVQESQEASSQESRKAAKSEEGQKARTAPETEAPASKKPAESGGGVIQELDRSLFSQPQDVPTERFLNENVASDRGRDALRTIASDPQGDGADIVRTLEQRDVKVAENNDQLETGVLGFFDPNTNEINVDPSLSDDDYLRTQIHEGLHAASDRFGDSKYEEGLNNVISDQIASRLTDSEAGSAVKIFSETARQYPGLPVTNPFNESLSETGVDVKDYVGFSGFLDNFRTDEAASTEAEAEVTPIRDASLVIEGGDNPDDVRGAVENSIVIANTNGGDDITDLTATGSAVTLNTGDDNDATRLALDGGSAGLVDAGTGSDFTVVETSENSAVSVDAGDGNDFTVSGGKDSLVNLIGGEGLDTTVAQGENNRVNVDAGNGSDLTEIDQTDSTVTVSAGADNDQTIVNTVNGTNILDAGDGNDETQVFTQGSETVLNNGAGDDATLAVTTDATTTINGDEGVDATLLTAFGGQTTINGGDGDDFAVAITQDSETTLRGGRGNDSTAVTAFGGKTIVKGGRGDDFTVAITQDSETTLRGGRGNDTTAVTAFGGKTTVGGGRGNDTIIAAVENSDTTVRGGRGNDTLNVTATGGKTVVNGGRGNDTLNIGATNGEVTVNAGDGDDVIRIENSTGSTFFISTGGGRDTIFIGSNVQDSSLNFDESTADDEIIYGQPFGGGLSLTA